MYLCSGMRHVPVCSSFTWIVTSTLRLTNTKCKPSSKTMCNCRDKKAMPSAKEMRNRMCNILGKRLTQDHQQARLKTRFSQKHIKMERNPFTVAWIILKYKCSKTKFKGLKCVRSSHVHLTYVQRATDVKWGKSQVKWWKTGLPNYTFHLSLQF